MIDKKMENPYYVLGEAFVDSVVAGNTGKIEGKQIGLADRLRTYAHYVQENATEAGDALLVNDLLDAAKRLRTPPRATAQGSQVVAEIVAERARQDEALKYNYYAHRAQVLATLIRRKIAQPLPLQEGGPQQTEILCEGCPPIGYPTDITRCLPCPRRLQEASERGGA